MLSLSQNVTEEMPESIAAPHEVEGASSPEPIGVEISSVAKGVERIIGGASKEVIGVQDAVDGTITVNGYNKFPVFSDISRKDPLSLARAVYDQSEERFGRGSSRGAMVMADIAA